MKIFRNRKISGKSTQEEKKVKTVGAYTFTCKECGYAVKIPYVKESELTAWVKENEWIKDGDEYICPRCIALRDADE